MIQIHLWAPTIAYIADWEQKIDECIEEVRSNFPLLEIGPIITHIRQRTFDIQSCGPTLDEALFIPLVRQIHLFIVTDQDIIPLDQFRLLDDFVHLDSFSRSTRRIHNVIFDLLTPDENSKLKIIEVKKGFKDLSCLLNSRTYTSDFSQSLHDAPFEECNNCNLAIKSLLSDIFIQISSEIVLSEIWLQNDPSAYMGTS
jgi:hypothetical protein